MSQEDVATLLAYIASAIGSSQGQLIAIRGSIPEPYHAELNAVAINLKAAQDALYTIVKVIR